MFSELIRIAGIPVRAALLGFSAFVLALASILDPKIWDNVTWFDIKRRILYG